MNTTILDMLRQRERMTVVEFARSLEVTATAVRQQLQRLLAEGLIERTPSRGSRGRPRHEYCLTEKGRRTSGNNFADLAMALWLEIRAIPSPDIRRGLLQRLAARLSSFYAGQVTGENPQVRMESVADLFADREIPLRVRLEGELPVIDALSCPYPQLAQQDRTICSLEKLMFSELLQTPLKLSQCRLDGDHCCTFTASPRGAGESGEREGESTTSLPD